MAKQTVIYAKDIKAMHLTEEEKWIVEGWAYDYKCPGTHNSVQFYFEFGNISSCEDTRTAWRKFIDWTVRDFCKRQGSERVSLKEYCLYVALKFGVYECNVRRQIKGAAIYNNHIYIADTFGLDHLEYIK